MSDGDKLLMVGSIQIPFVSGLDLRQTYRQDGGQFFVRMHDGSLKTQRNWTKLITEVSADGWIAPPLSALDTSLSYTIGCVQPRALYSASNVIQLPAARRTDSGYEPFGTALLPDSEAVDTAVSMAGDTATLTPVPGALQYSVSYFPEFTAYITEYSESHDDADAGWSWAFTAREL